MKLHPKALFTAMLLAAAAATAAEVAPQAVADRAVGQFGQELRQKLVESIQKKGPAGAIDVCAKDAPVISSRIENELGVTVKRTSLQVRNPRNAPDAAEKQLLETLAADRKAGRTLPAGVTVFPDNPRRFYKIITVEQTCLSCHGNSLTMSEQVRREIAAGYPQDRAVGYEKGDLRGIISVLVK